MPASADEDATNTDDDVEQSDPWRGLSFGHSLQVWHIGGPGFHSGCRGESRNGYQKSKQGDDDNESRDGFVRRSDSGTDPSPEQSGGNSEHKGSDAPNEGSFIGPWLKGTFRAEGEISRSEQDEYSPHHGRIASHHGEDISHHCGKFTRKKGWSRAGPERVPKRPLSESEASSKIR